MKVVSIQRISFNSNDETEMNFLDANKEDLQEMGFILTNEPNEDNEYIAMKMQEDVYKIKENIINKERIFS